MMNYKSLIREVPDFPIPGVSFKDITPLLANDQYLKMILEDVGKILNVDSCDAFVGIESRGFILAAALAARFEKGFIALRKAGKLPPPTFKTSYKLEYGEASLELPPGNGKVIIVDDVLATGGTLKAAILLCGQAGYEIKDLFVFINLTTLNQMTFKDQRIKSLVSY